MNYRRFYRELEERLKTESMVTVSTGLNGPERGKKTFAKRDDESAFCEQFCGCPAVVICGGGHIALAVARILAQLEYHITVVDDRAEYANAERFPMAADIRCLDFEREFPQAVFPEHAYYVIVTRGHEHDYICLKQVLGRTYRYVGMIGSRSKVRLARERLLKEGISPEQIADVHAPIGLPIDGRTPAEIAVSIAAEMIQVKNDALYSIWEEAVSEGLQQKDSSVMVTVIEKHGSSPRGKGSRMVVRADGKTYGSIGGGAVEYEAIAQARRLCREGEFETAEYDLSNAQAATLGMVCGGRMKVMFEPLGEEGERI